jgi:FkbM family methyltransferase
VKRIYRFVKRVASRLGFEIKRIPPAVAPGSFVFRQVGKFVLSMPAEHMIADYLEKIPQYNRNLPRLVAVTRLKYPDADLVDVGANIGDSAALVRSVNDCRVICIEGDETYLQFLRENAPKIGSVDIIAHFVGSERGAFPAKLSRQLGTTQIIVTSQSDTIQFTTLDDLWAIDRAKFKTSRILKIDTDGFDIHVLRGATRFIAEQNPVIFFEYSPFHIDQIGDDPLSVFDLLSNSGYSQIIFYDNFGRLLIKLPTGYRSAIRDLTHYVRDQDGKFNYFDIAAFRQFDEDLADSLVRLEHEASNRIA